MTTRDYIRITGEVRGRRMASLIMENARRIRLHDDEEPVVCHVTYDDDSAYVKNEITYGDTFTDLMEIFRKLFPNSEVWAVAEPKTSEAYGQFKVT